MRLTLDYRVIMRARTMKSRCPLLLLLQLIINCITSATGISNKPLSFMQFDPPFVHDLIIGNNRSVELSLKLNSFQRSKFSNRSLIFDIASLNPDIAEVVNSEKIPLPQAMNDHLGNSVYKVNVKLMGHFLGKTHVKARLVYMEDDAFDPYFEIPTNEPMLDVWVSQDSKRVVNNVFLVSLIILIVIANILMGCELDTSLVFTTIKKPVAPLIGFFTQFLAMPLLAFGIARMIFIPHGLHSFALGVFITGCAPGGGASNYWTILLEGNLPVSITMTFVSTLAALAMMPFWIWALGFHFFRGYQAEAHILVPYWKIISSLLTMIIPLVIGIGLARWKPGIKPKARKIMRPFIIFVLIFLIGFGTAANWYMVKIITWRAVLGGLLLPWCGFAIGCFIAIFLRQPPSNVTAIAIETGIQNTGIAIILLKVSFPDPDADISALIPVIAASMTPVPLLLVVGVHWLCTFARKKRENQNDIECNKDQNLSIDIKDPIAIEEVNPLMIMLSNLTHSIGEDQRTTIR